MRREYRELIVDVLDRMDAAMPGHDTPDGLVVELDAQNSPRSASAGTFASSFAVPPLFSGSGPFSQKQVEGEVLTEILVRQEMAS
jgi:hypothetical protein